MVYGFILTPALFIILMSFSPDVIATFPPPGLTIKWYIALFQDVRLVAAIKNSLFIGLSAILVSGLLGTMTSIGMVRYKFRGRGLLSAFVIAPMVIPEIILGASLLTFFVSLGLSLSQFSYLFMIIGHALFTLPYVVLNVHARVYGLDRSLEEASMNLGANPIQTFREVTLPLILPAVLSGMLLAFAMSLDDYTASQFWVMPQTETIPVRIFSALRTELPPTINPLATILMLSTLFAFFLQVRISRRVTVRRRK
jgi:spermidine/putrescine transport system permease protein